MVELPSDRGQIGVRCKHENHEAASKAASRRFCIITSDVTLLLRKIIEITYILLAFLSILYILTVFHHFAETTYS